MRGPKKTQPATESELAIPAPGLDTPDEQLMAELLTARSLKLPQRKVGSHNLTLILERVSWEMERKRQRVRFAVGMVGWGIAACLACWLGLAKPGAKPAITPVGGEKAGHFSGKSPERAPSGTNSGDSAMAEPSTNPDGAGADPAEDNHDPESGHGTVRVSKPTLPEMERQLRLVQERLQRLEQREEDRATPSPDLARLMVVELSDPKTKPKISAAPGDLAERVLALMSRNLTTRVQKPGAEDLSGVTPPEITLGDASQRNPLATGSPDLASAMEPDGSASSLAPNHRSRGEGGEVPESSDAFVTYDETLGQGMLILGSMPTLADGQVYQLWVRNPEDGSLSSPGLLPPQENAATPVSFSLGKPLPAPSEFFITVENSPQGATVPSQEVLRRWSGPESGQGP